MREFDEGVIEGNDNARHASHTQQLTPYTIQTQQLRVRSETVYETVRRTHLLNTCIAKWCRLTVNESTQIISIEHSKQQSSKAKWDINAKESEIWNAKLCFTTKNRNMNCIMHTTNLAAVITMRMRIIINHETKLIVVNKLQLNWMSFRWLSNIYYEECRTDIVLSLSQYRHTNRVAHHYLRLRKCFCSCKQESCASKLKWTQLRGVKFKQKHPLSILYLHVNVR